MKSALWLTSLFLVACAGGNRGGDGNDDTPDLKKPSMAVGSIVINEVNPNGPDEATDPDWIELKNIGSASIDLSNWKIRDNDVAHLTTFSNETLAAGAYLVIKCDDGLGGGTMWKLSSSAGDEVHLFDEKGTEVDGTSFAANAVMDGQSWGRTPDGTGSFAVLGSLSKGTKNP